MEQNEAKPLELPKIGDKVIYKDSICEIIDIQTSEFEMVYPIIKICLAARGKAK